MADMMRRGIEHLKKRMGQWASVTINYHRGNITVPLVGKAWVGSTLFKIQDGNNQRMEWGDRDYLIPVNMLKINGVLTEPLKGDWISEVFAGTTITFELSAPGDEPVWRFDDEYRLIYLLHTKRVTT